MVTRQLVSAGWAMLGTIECHEPGEVSIGFEAGTAAYLMVDAVRFVQEPEPSKVRCSSEPSAGVGQQELASRRGYDIRWIASTSWWSSHCRSDKATKRSCCHSCRPLISHAGEDREMP